MKEYANFDIELLGYESAGGRESMRARVIDSPSEGSESDQDATPVEFPEGLRALLAQLEGRQLESGDMLALGTKLGLLLVPVHARGRFNNSLARLAPDHGLRIRIRSDVPELAALPWELACVVPPDVTAGQAGPECLLALNRRISIVRYEGRVPAAALSPLSREEIKVAALLADVADPAYPALDLAKEELNLRRSLQGIARVEADFFEPGTVRQLETALDSGIQVLHFAGHGEWRTRMGEDPGSVEGTGVLVLADEERKPAPLDVGQLAANLRAKGVRLVVLASCEGARRDAVNAWSGIAPALMREGIPACIGMQFRVRDAGAIAFSSRLYDRLAAGVSIDTAVSEARLAVFTRTGVGDRDWGAPVLYLRSPENMLFPPPPGPLRLNLALLAACVVVVGVWFYLHLFPLLDALFSRWTRLLGGAGVVAGILAMGRLAASLVQPPTTEAMPVLHRILRKTAATWLLAPLLVVATLLVGVSGSFWLDLDDEQAEVVLAFTPPGNAPFARDGELRVGRNRSVAGGPYLFPIRGPLKVTVKEPPGWVLREPSSPRLWLPVHLRFPGDFEEKGLRVLVLATGVGLSWPPVGEPAGRTFRLDVTIGGKTYPLDDVRPGLVYVGASEDVLRERADQEPPDVLATSLGACIPDPAQKDAWLSEWRGPAPRFVATPLLGQGDGVVVRVSNNENQKTCLEDTLPASRLPAGRISVSCLVRELDCE